MSRALMKIIGGQAALIICCVFYMIWWFLCYKPGTSVNRIGSWRGLLLLVTAACGFAGAFLILTSLGNLPLSQPNRFSGTAVILGGIITYAALACITHFVWKRPVTTELVLIVGWAMLEVSLCGSLNSAGIFNDHRLTAAVIIIAIAFLISMILYVLYYRMEEMQAYYLAVVPLITEAVSMGCILGMILHN